MIVFETNLYNLAFDNVLVLKFLFIGVMDFLHQIAKKINCLTEIREI